MAQSRLEKIGTIYSRTKALFRGGAMKEEDRPLWYTIYEAFPPKVEPKYDRQAPKIPIKPIFYEEDVIRAKFQKEYKNLLGTTLLNAKSKSRTQKFISIYKEMQQSDVPENELYSKAVEAYTVQIGATKNQLADRELENKNFDTKKSEVHINLKEVFHN